MTKEEKDLITMAWSKLYVSIALLDQADIVGFKETIKFNLETARDILWDLTKEDKDGRQE